MPVVHTLFVVLSSVVIVATCLSAVRTVVLPRGETALLTRFVFYVTRRCFEMIARLHDNYGYRDRVMARYGPIALISIAATWVVIVLLAGMVLFRGLGVPSWHLAFQISGSSLTTMGSTAATSDATRVVSVIEAVVGLGLVALMIGYLSTVYTSFQRRELAVALLEVRAGDPPSAVEMIRRHAHIGRVEAIMELFVDWETWFADVEESHTSQPGLAWFRSPLPGRSWITAAGAVLDGAALVCAAVDMPRRPEPQLCIRAGYLSLRRIATIFRIEYDPDPPADGTISVTREEFDEAVTDLAAAGVPIKSDRDHAWREFVGWRVNYDQVLVEIAGTVMAPSAPWSSDRVPLKVRS